MKFASSWWSLILLQICFSDHCLASSFVIDRCKQETKLTQVCQIDGKVGTKGEEVSVYSKTTWVGAGTILNSNKILTIVRIEETTSHVFPGFEVVNTSRAKTMELDPKNMFSKSDLY
ncbi:MAG: hypothetical protein HRU09_14465 [Oligoflexales bacterium]|nr:hypothetical protein [Oligoflexales bacterium]